MTLHENELKTKSNHQTIDPIRRPKIACDILGVSLATYYRLVKTGKLKHIKISPRTSGTPQSSIDELLKNGTQ